jgi:RNA polymerase sigma factor (TIGR02999 family)
MRRDWQPLSKTYFWHQSFWLAILLAMSEVTHILSQIEQGDPQAAANLLPLVYHELRKLAAVKMAQEKPGQTLQATALVHEAYVRLVGGEQHQNWDSRAHFFAAAAEAMRRILVESARRKQRLKRGGALEREPLDEQAITAPATDADLLELDAALDKLAAKDRRKAELIKLRYFACLTIEQAAQTLEISTATAERDWTYARAWLFREMGKGMS